MAKKATKKAKAKTAMPKPLEGSVWRRGMTLEQALDHLQHDTAAKLDSIHRIVLPLVGEVRVIHRTTKLVPGSRVHHHTGGSGRIQMISRGVAFVDWDNGRANSIDLVDLAAEDYL